MHYFILTFEFQAVVKFFDQVMAAILRHLNFEVVKAVLIASPGFVKDQFLEHMMKVSTLNYEVSFVGI